MANESEKKESWQARRKREQLEEHKRLHARLSATRTEGEKMLDKAFPREPGHGHVADSRLITIFGVRHRFYAVVMADYDESLGFTVTFRIAVHDSLPGVQCHNTGFDMLYGSIGSDSIEGIRRIVAERFSDIPVVNK